MHDQQDDADHQRQVIDSARHMESEEPGKPEDDENDGDGSQYGEHSFMLAKRRRAVSPQSLLEKYLILL